MNSIFHGKRIYKRICIYNIEPRQTTTNKTENDKMKTAQRKSAKELQIFSSKVDNNNALIFLYVFFAFFLSIDVVVAHCNHCLTKRNHWT